jgi:hypothetical protein
MGGNALRVRRVLQIVPDGLVQYEYRRGPIDPAHPWPRRSTATLAAFGHQAVREVPADWTPDTDDV